MEFEEREGFDNTCNVKGCKQESHLLMPSIDLPRQLCNVHGMEYIKEKNPRIEEEWENIMLSGLNG